MVQLQNIVTQTQTLFNSLLDYHSSKNTLSNNQTKQLLKAINLINEALMILLNLSNSVQDDNARSKVTKAPKKLD